MPFTWPTYNTFYVYFSYPLISSRLEMIEVYFHLIVWPLAFMRVDGQAFKSPKTEAVSCKRRVLVMGSDHGFSHVRTKKTMKKSQDFRTD